MCDTNKKNSVVCTNTKLRTSLIYSQWVKQYIDRPVTFSYYHVVTITAFLLFSGRYKIVDTIWGQENLKQK